MNYDIERSIKKAIENRDRKWLVVYFPNNESGTVYISESSYQLLLKAVENKIESHEPQTFKLKDGRMLSTEFKFVIPNPEWRDPVEGYRQLVYNRCRREYQERVQNGEDLTWEEYAKQKKEANRKEMDEFLSQLNDQK